MGSSGGSSASASLVALLAAAILAGCAPLAERSARGDARLARGLAQANLAQIAAGRLAAAKARTRAVRQYGARIAKAHTRLQAEAGELKSAEGVPLPTRPDQAQELALRDLERLPPERFDRAFLEHAVQSYEAALRLFERAAFDAGDPALAGYAQRALPQVRAHLDLARHTLARLAPS